MLVATPGLRLPLEIDVICGMIVIECVALSLVADCRAERVRRPTGTLGTVQAVDVITPVAPGVRLHTNIPTIVIVTESPAVQLLPLRLMTMPGPAVAGDSVIVGTAALAAGAAR
jgi:hypothetical protein